MAIRLEHRYKERPTSINRLGVFTSIELPCLVFEAEDENQALIYAYNTLGTSRQGLPLDRIEIDSREAENVFGVTAYYGSGASGGSGGGDDNATTVSFDSSGGTRHINQAQSQRCVYGSLSAGTAVNWNGKLGDSMQVSGVDIPTAQMRETYSKTMTKGRLNTSFKRKVARMTGKVNSKPFKGWEPGEVMFLGATYSGEGIRMTVNFNFAIQENESATEVAGITVGKKKGWEYTWMIPDTLVVDGVPTQKVAGVYIAEVVQYADLNELGV